MKGPRNTPRFRLVNGCRALAKWLVGIELACAGAAAYAQTTATPPRTLDLAGEWRFLPNNGPTSFAGLRVNDSRWPVMRLPSNWFLQGSTTYPANVDKGGGNSGGPGDLWPIDPQAGLDWNGTVWFRRSFDWEPNPQMRAILDLDMVDYIADVFVNGANVGTHEGYFQKWSLDVTRRLRSGRNLIAIRVSAPELPFDMSARYPISWPKQQNQVKGIFLYHDTRPGATSPADRNVPPAEFCAACLYARVRVWISLASTSPAST